MLRHDRGRKGGGKGGGKGPKPQKQKEPKGGSKIGTSPSQDGKKGGGK